MSVQIKGVGTIGGIDQGLNTTGVITATSFVGSGANLTNLPAQATIANNADNRIITGGSGVNLNAEANVLYDGTNFGIGKSPSRTLDVQGKIRSSDSVCFGDNSSTPSEGVAIHRPAASTLALVTNNTERLRITNAGIIGIGTDAPYTNGLLHCDGHLVLTAAGNAPKIIFDEYGTGTDPKAQIEMDQESSTAASMRFYTEASGTLSERLRIASNGALGIAGANYGSSGQVLTSGGSGSAPTWSTVASGGASNISFNSGYGIDFSATADGTGSSQAEILDDYEEGSWTPTVSTGNASFSTMTGRYVKIGRQVTLWFRISGGGSYSGSSSLGLQGIPFSNNTAVNPIGTSEFYKIDFARDYSDLVTCYLAGSTIRWLRNSSGGGSGNYLTINLFYSGAAITTCITYETDS